MKLLYPFMANYCIINNLNPKLIELLECPAGNIVVGILTTDFDNMGEVISLIEGSSANIVYYDIDENKLTIGNNNEDMNNIKLVPLQRIYSLIDNICKYADIYEKDRKKFEDMKKIDIWEYYQADNNFYLKDSNIKMQKRKERESANKKLMKEKFPDVQIRSLFFDFNLGLLEAYDESKHFYIDETTQDCTLMSDKFLTDSKSDIRNFLQLIIELPTFDILLQNFTHIVDQKYKQELKRNDPKFFKYEFKMNPNLREAALIPNFENTYNIIKIGFERRKKSKSLDKLFRVLTYNTITIPSPKFEKLPYYQNNIFIDPFHEELIIHEESVPLNKAKIDFSFMNVDLKDQFDYIKNLLRDEMTNLHSKEKSTQITQKKLESNDTIKKDILNILRNITFNLNEKNPLTLEFKNYLLNNPEVVKNFYGFMLTNLRNLINKKNENKDSVKKVINGNTVKVEEQDNNNNYNKNQNYLDNNENKNLNPFKTNNTPYSKTGKSEYIKNFNFFFDTYIKERTNPIVEFQINFGVNLIQSVSFCEYCKKPNTLWDIKKEFIYSKTKKESKTLCKFCGQYFVPYFFIIEGMNDAKINDNLNKGKRMMKNRSFDGNSNHGDYMEEIQTDFIPNKNDLDNSKIIRKVEFMSFEHLIAMYYDYDNEEKTEKQNRVKKFPYSLFYNICLLLGEVKIRIGKHRNMEFFTFDLYMKRQINKNVESLKKGKYDDNNENIDSDIASSNRNSNNVLKIFRDNYLKKKKEIEENRKSAKGVKNKNYLSMHKTKTMQNVKDQMVNVKFDLKDIIHDVKYKEFEKDLKDLPQFNKGNVMTVIKNFEKTKTIISETGKNKTHKCVSPFSTNNFKISSNNIRNTLTVTKTDNLRVSINTNMITINTSKSPSKSPNTKFEINLVNKNRTTIRTSPKKNTLKGKVKIKVKKNEETLQYHTYANFQTVKTENEEFILNSPDDNFVLRKLVDEDTNLFKQNLGVQIMNHKSQNKLPAQIHPWLKFKIDNAKTNNNFDRYEIHSNFDNNQYNKNYKKSHTRDSNFIKMYDELSSNRSPTINNEFFPIKNNLNHYAKK